MFLLSSVTPDTNALSVITSIGDSLKSKTLVVTLLVLASILSSVNLLVLVRKLKCPTLMLGRISKNHSLLLESLAHPSRDILLPLDGEMMLISLLLVSIVSNLIA